MMDVSNQIARRRAFRCRPQSWDFELVAVERRRGETIPVDDLQLSTATRSTLARNVGCCGVVLAGTSRPRATTSVVGNLDAAHGCRNVFTFTRSLLPFPRAGNRTPNPFLQRTTAYFSADAIKWAGICEKSLRSSHSPASVVAPAVVSAQLPDGPGKGTPSSRCAAPVISRSAPRRSGLTRDGWSEGPRRTWLKRGAKGGATKR